MLAGLDEVFPGLRITANISLIDSPVAVCTASMRPTAKARFCASLRPWRISQEIIDMTALPLCGHFTKLIAAVG
ncbi:hypothetical protein [Mycobacterium sp. 050134]|uniref:hypothetical protein n=1 Tax=Mycobacterium sp. 050134 TaxID=3096111 RepID=UPI002ED943AA